jgi:hypothetical protein
MTLKAVSERIETWQFRTREALTRQERVRSQGFKTAYTLAHDAHYERGFFGYLAMAFRQLICSDPTIRKQLKSKVDAARHASHPIKYTTPETRAGAGVLALGAFLVNVAPVFGYLVAPAIAGFVMLLCSVGVMLSVNGQVRSRRSGLPTVKDDKRDVLRPTLTSRLLIK